MNKTLRIYQLGLPTLPCGLILVIHYFVPNITNFSVEQQLAIFKFIFILCVVVYIIGVAFTLTKLQDESQIDELFSRIL